MSSGKSNWKSVFTAQEVSQHNGPGDLWIIIRNKVYNISKFVFEHPGGEIPLFDQAGEDATEAFQDIGHSEDAEELMKKYYIGDLHEHPGGDEVLLEQAGQVSTEAFEDVGHSEDARELMKDFYIGDLCEGDKEPLYEQYHGKAAQDNSRSVLSWFIPTAISVGIIAIALYKMMSS